MCMSKYTVKLQDAACLESLKKRFQVCCYLEDLNTCIIECPKEREEELRQFPGVKHVLPDNLNIRLYYTQPVNYAENDIWPLGHISNQPSRTEYVFPTTGKGCDILVIDKGINPVHSESEPFTKDLVFNRVNLSGLEDYTFYLVPKKYRLPEYISNGWINYISHFDIDRTFFGRKNYQKSILIKQEKGRDFAEVHLEKTAESKCFLDFIFTRIKRSILITVFNYLILCRVIGRSGDYSFLCRTGISNENIIDMGYRDVMLNAYIMKPPRYRGTWTGHNRFDCLCPSIYTTAIPAIVCIERSGFSSIIHGTMVSGCAAGLHVGIAKDAHCIAVNTILTADSIAACFQACISFHKKKIELGINRPTVVNMSWGGTTDYQEILEFFWEYFDAMIDCGIILVAAAGNDRAKIVRNGNHFPGSYERVITVGALDINDNLAYFSNYGSGVDLFAPGQRVLTSAMPHPYSDIVDNNLWGSNYDYYKNIYASASGTSFSSPYTAGVICCALEALEADIFTNGQQVDEFKQWFLENYTRPWTPEKHYIGPFPPKSTEDIENPANWADGWPSDDDGSPNRCLWMNPAFYRTTEKFSFPKTDGLVCHHNDLVFRHENGGISVEEKDTSVKLGRLEATEIYKRFHGRKGVHEVVVEKDDSLTRTLIVEKPKRAGVFAK